MNIETILRIFLVVIVVHTAVASTDVTPLPRVAGFGLGHCKGRNVRTALVNCRTDNFRVGG